MIFQQRICRSFVFALIFTSLLSGPALVFAAARDAVESPPWLMSVRQFNLIIFQAEAAAVQPLLPGGVKIKASKDGKVKLVLEAYETERTSGIAPFQIAFIAVQIEGHDSRNGTPAHFALWGTVGDFNALRHFQQVYNFPYSLAESIVLDQHQGAYRGLINTAGSGSISFRVESLEDQPFAQTGVVNMVGKLADDQLVIGEVPYLTRGNVARVLEVKVNSRNNPVLAILKTAQPIWSMVSVDQTFSYANSTPVPLLAVQ